MSVSSQAMAWEPDANPFGDYARPMPKNVGNPQIDKNNGMYSQQICGPELVCQFGECNTQIVCR